jgi:hypothetical protein
LGFPLLAFLLRLACSLSYIPVHLCSSVSICG